MLWAILCDAWMYEHIFTSSNAMRYFGDACNLLTLMGSCSAECNPLIAEEIRLRELRFIEPSASLWKLMCEGGLSPTRLQKGLASEIMGAGFFRRDITTLASVVAVVYLKHFGPHDIQLNDGYLSRVLIECWMASDGDESGHQAIMELTTMMSVSSAPEINKFVQTNLVEANRVKQFLNLWITVTQKPLSDKRLSILFEFMLKFLELNEGSDLRKRIMRSAPMATSNACKRQLCSGRSDPDDNADIFTNGIRLMILFSCHPTQSIQDVFRLVNDAYIIPIICKSLKHYASCIPNDYRDRNFDANLVTVSRLLEAVIEREPPTQAVLHDASNLRRTVMKYWQPTLDELRLLPAAAFPSRDHVAKVWAEFGRGVCHILDGVLIVDPLPIGNGEEMAYRFKRCHNEECICYETAGVHKMFVCRGCWRAMYCNTQCQQKDWRAGHKDICRSIEQP